MRVTTPPDHFEVSMTAAVQLLASETLSTFMPFVALFMTVAAVTIVVRHGARDLARTPRQRWDRPMASRSPSTGIRPSA